MFSIFDGRSEFYQWDLDRKLIVNDSSIKQVHFCNRTGECSLVRVPYEVNGMYLVDVPNVILQNDLRINDYGYDANYTKHSDKFNVVKRSKPESYIYTDEEVRYWEEATAMAEEAKAAAQVAEEKAEEAYANAESVKAETAKLSFSLGNLYMEEKQGEILELKDMRGSVQELVTYIDGYAKPSNPNLIPVDLSDESNWEYNEEVGFWNYTLPNLPAGTYTVWHDGYACLLYVPGGEIYGNTPYTFTFTETANLNISTFDSPGGMNVKLEVGTKHTGEIIVANLIPVDLSKESNWRYYDEVGLYQYNLYDLSAGTYTMYSYGKYEFEVEAPGVYFSLEPKTPYTFTTNEKGSVQIRNWNGFLGAIKLERGTQFTGFADSNPNLIPPEYASGQDMFPYVEVFDACMISIELPAGTYTFYQENDWWDSMPFEDDTGELHYANCAEPYTFTHGGGSVRIFDYSGGVYYPIIKLEEGSEYTGTKVYTYDTEFNKVELTVNDTVYTAELSGPIVYGYYDWIRGQLHYDGTVEFYEPQEIEVRNNSTLSSSTGETRIVYGRDLTSVIEELQYAIISLGGNV